MEIRRAMPVIKTDDPEESRAFYEGFLGFRVAMEQEGMLMLASETKTPTTQILVAWECEEPSDPRVLEVDVSVEVADADAALAAAQEQGLEVVYPIMDQPSGIRRFFVRDPSGRTINVAAHIGGPSAEAGGAVAVEPEIENQNCCTDRGLQRPSSRCGRGTASTS